MHLFNEVFMEKSLSCVYPERLDVRVRERLTYLLGKLIRLFLKPPIIVHHLEEFTY